MNTLKTYYLVTKPGIIMGNLIAAVAGFALPSKGHFDALVFLAMFTGLGMIIGSACVFNNYIDLDADSKMARTKNRPLVQGLISGKAAIGFAMILGLFGFSLLAFCTNWLATFVAGIGFFIYVVLYSHWKYHNSLATLVGSVSGAIPPVVGYCAASNVFDLGAALLFLILFTWQMPHFFSIAMFRMRDYKAAGIPVLPLEKGVRAAKLQTVYYILAFFFAELSLFVFGYAGLFYIAAGGGLTLLWLWLSIQGFQAADDVLWAKKMFRLSLLIITVISFAISMEGIL